MTKRAIHTNMIGARVRVTSSPLYSPTIPERHVGKEAEVVAVYQDEDQTLVMTLRMFGSPEKPESELWDRVYTAWFEVVEMDWAKSAR